MLLSHGTQKRYKSNRRLIWSVRALTSVWVEKVIAWRDSPARAVRVSPRYFSCLQWFSLCHVQNSLEHFPLALTILLISARSHSRTPRWALISGKTRNIQPLTASDITEISSTIHLRIRSQWLFNGITEPRVNADEGQSIIVLRRRIKPW